MFRSRSNKTETIHTSSLSSGNASIQRYDNTPDYNEEEYNAEIIDLQATTNDLTIESMSAVIAAAVQLSAVGGSPSSLSLGSASILQPFSKTEQVEENKRQVKRRFSSRLFTNPWSKKLNNSPTSPINTPATPALEPSSSPFDSNISDDNSSQGDSPRNSSVSSPKDISDDGRDELLYRGIQIKEIKTTLKTLVISDQDRCPMPEVRLERPGFARINY